MKPFLFTVFLFCCAVTLHMAAGAASFTDDMDHLTSDAITKYEGLSLATSMGDIPDKTRVTFSNLMSPVGSAVYRVTGATSIQAVIYSQVGTFVHPHHSDPGKYMMGIYPGGSMNPSGMTQALYCPVSDAVYTSLGGLKQMQYDENYAYAFGEVRVQPVGRLIGYGINFYFSYDGLNFTRAEAQWQEVRYDFVFDSYCYERYMAAVPVDAKYVKVEINDVTKTPLSGGGEVPNSFEKMWLASVTITGERLVMGEPEPVVELPSSSTSKIEIEIHYNSEKPESSSSRKTEAAASDGPEAGADTEKPPSSKFEGTITSSSKAEKSKNQASVIEVKPESVKKEPGQEASEEESVEVQGQEIQIVRENQADMPKTAVTIYIIAATGAIVLLLLKK